MNTIDIQLHVSVDLMIFMDCVINDAAATQAKRFDAGTSDAGKESYKHSSSGSFNCSWSGTCLRSTEVSLLPMRVVLVAADVVLVPGLIKRNIRIRVSDFIRQIVQLILPSNFELTKVTF